MSTSHCSRGSGSFFLLRVSGGGLLLGLLLCGCSVDQVVYQGRPCDSDDQCGGGTRCDPASKTCQPGGAQDAGKDGTPKKDSHKDGKPPAPDTYKIPDALLVDQLKVPDSGCPTGTKKCGSTCVNLQTNSKHCGACNNVCPKAEGDTCAGGKCHCGSGPVCTNGLTCVAQICRCVAGGLCKGCCDGDVCRSPVVGKCGAGGMKCISCVDTNPCTTDSCSAAGTCVHANTTGACDDKDACTVNDQCMAGKCLGSKKSCDDGLSCTTDSCDKSKSKGGCVNTVSVGYCAIGTGCYKSGAINPSSSCLTCQPAQSASSWTAAKGCVSTLAGSGATGCTDGLASSATFYGPTGIAVDAAGRVYVAELSNNVIRTIYKGTVSVLAGVCTKSGSADGPASSATFNGPQDVAVDAAGNVYVADDGNFRIRKISGGKVTTFAGSSKGFADGLALSARFASPQSLVSTASGTLFVVDTTNNLIRRISGGKVSTLAGTGVSGSTDGALLSATFSWPHTISMDPAGNLYIGESYWVRKISGSQVTTLVKPTAGCSGLHSVQGTAADAAGKVYIADFSGHRIRTYIPGLKLSTLTGQCPVKGSTDGLLSTALFNYPNGLALMSGKLYVADYQNHRIRVISLP